VLGSGGNVGFCWQWGVLTSLRDAGIDLTADLIVGTSAGASTAAELSSPADPHDMLAGLDVPAKARDSAPAPEHFGAVLKDLLSRGLSSQEILVGIGEFALNTPAAPEALLRKLAMAYMTVHDWPSANIQIPAIDATTGEMVVFSRDSGVTLVDAIAATGAVPGIFSPVTIDGRRYIDASMRSATNADIAAGHDKVLVVAPVKGIRGMPGADLDSALAPVRARGEAFVIQPDETSKAAIGRDVMDLSKRAGAAKAGLAQGTALADEIRIFWG
jgi:NTE family protein